MTVDTSQDTIAKHLKFYGIFSHIFYGKFSAEFVDERTFIGQHGEVRGMKADSLTRSVRLALSCRKMNWTEIFSRPIARNSCC